VSISAASSFLPKVAVSSADVDNLPLSANELFVRIPLYNLLLLL
jgi:hypothetical protein